MNKQGTLCWFRRHMLVGGLLGLGLGGLGHVLVYALAAGELDATPAQCIAATLYTAAAWVVLAFFVALAGSWMLRHPGGRIAALALSSIVIGLVCLASVGGSALRIVSGSYLTLGALHFTLNAADHFMHAVVSGYAGYFSIMVLTTLVFGAGIARALSPAARPPAVLRARDSGAVTLLSIAVAALYLGRGDSRFLRGMFVSGPLLALVSSMETGFELDRAMAASEGTGEPLAPPGPPLDAEIRWNAALAAHGGEKPKVLFVVLESIAPSHMSLYGYARPTTPHLDALARESLHMTHAWTTATHSNYAQPAVLSSLFPRRRQWLDMYDALDYPRVLLHDVFHRLGYDTATISSQDEDWQGMRKFQDTGTPTFYWHADNYTGPKIDSGVEQYAPDDATTEVALDWLEQRKHAPWSLYLNFQGTHFPYTISPRAPRPFLPDEPNWATFGYLGFPESDKEVVVNRYDNALRFADEQLGRVFDHLRDSGELDDTIIVVTADHGEMFFERGLVTHGKTLHEIEARVPILIRWPSRLAPEVREDPVSHIDILPTLLDVMGLPPHPSWQGTSFLEPSPRAIYMNIQGLRFADAIVCWPWKLILERTSKKPYLYQLADDPDEQTNLVARRPMIAALLEETLSRQILAQLDYHQNDALRQREFAPRMRPCPELP